MAPLSDVPKRIIRHGATHMDMGGTEEIKQAIVECLREIYPRGRTEGGISVTCFKGRTGADGQHLIGFGGGAKLTKALDELVEEHMIVSNGGHGESVFHYKTDASPPVVGQMEEIKLAIVECLCGISPRELVRVGIELECFKDRYGSPLTGDNGLPLVEGGDGGKIQKALDELVADGKIDAYEKELDGGCRIHYRAKASNSITPRPTLRLAGKGAASGRRSRSDRRAGMQREVGSVQGEVDITVPKSEDECNEFKETFAVPVAGGNANDLKLEVAIAVAAFANTEGGRLFVGVRDDGTLAGLKWDLRRYKNLDKLQLAIRDYLKDKSGRPMSDVRFRFKGDDYLVIAIPKLGVDDWVYVEGDFYVRDGNRSQKLNSQETSEYQRTH